MGKNNTRPGILILDDDCYEGNPRERKIKELLSDCCDIKTLNYFTNESWEREEIAVFIKLKDIEDANIDILIFDLDLLRTGEWMDGIKIMRKIKDKLPSVWNKPKIIISTHVDEAAKYLDKLDIPDNYRFHWVKLANDNDTQTNFIAIVKNIIHDL